MTNKLNIPHAKDFFIFEEDRFESFKSWPYDDKSKCNTRKMAEAGFYWKGNDKENDTAACFACDKVLDGWESNDDPWIEHHKHAPQCPFIKINKRENELKVDELLKLFQTVFVNKLQKKNNEHKLKFQSEVEKRKENLMQSYK